MMLSHLKNNIIFRPKFSTSVLKKHFIDDKYQNILIESEDKLGSLNDISNKLAQNNVNMVYVKSHFSNVWTKNKKYCLDITIQKQSQQKLQQLQKQFTSISKSFTLAEPIKVPWFPRNFNDLNLIGKVLLKVKQEANKDHLQFADQQYRKRRDFIAEVALNYKMGQKIPDIPYSNQQTQLWRRINEKLSVLHKKGMSRRYLTQMQKLQKQFMFSKRIPQLNQLNNYLKNKTNFTIKPTHGILSQRQFLNCFAFRVFCCTQYIRHHQTPDYTPQPDIVHQIIGHVPMFADPDVAELSQQIGLLSLGATDEQIAQLGSLYWFTLQFGACLQDNQKLGYGAGVASSIEELTNLMSEKPKFQTFCPMTDCKATYPIQTVQEVYRLTETFQKSLMDLQAFGKTITKPVNTTFNFQNFGIEYDRNIEGVDVGDIPIEFV